MKQGRSVAAHTALSGAEDSRILWPRTGSALSRLQEVGGALWKGLPRTPTPHRFCPTHPPRVFLPEWQVLYLLQFKFSPGGKKNWNMRPKRSNQNPLFATLIFRT